MRNFLNTEKLIEILSSNFDCDVQRDEIEKAWYISHPNPIINKTIIQLNMHKVEFKFESNEISWGNTNKQKEKIYNLDGWIVNELQVQHIVSKNMIELFLNNSAEFWDFALMQAEQQSSTITKECIMV